MKRAVEMEGTVTGEHGVGLIKRDYLARELGQSTVDAMRKVISHDESRMIWVNVCSRSSSKLSTLSAF